MYTCAFTYMCIHIYIYRYVEIHIYIYIYTDYGHEMSDIGKVTEKEKMQHSKIKKPQKCIHMYLIITSHIYIIGIYIYIYPIIA